MNSKELNDMASEVGIRSDDIFHLGTAVVDCSLPPELSDFIEFEGIAKVFDILGIDKDIYLGDIEDPALLPRWDLVDLFTEAIYNSDKFGFMVRFMTPYIDEDGEALGWGITTDKWFYGDTMEDILKDAVKWASEYRKERFFK